MGRAENWANACLMGEQHTWFYSIEAALEKQWGEQGLWISWDGMGGGQLGSKAHVGRKGLKSIGGSLGNIAMAPPPHPGDGLFWEMYFSVVPK